MRPKRADWVRSIPTVSWGAEGTYRGKLVGDRGAHRSPGRGTQGRGGAHSRPQKHRGRPRAVPVDAAWSRAAYRLAPAARFAAFRSFSVFRHSHGGVGDGSAHKPALRARAAISAGP